MSRTLTLRPRGLFTNPSELSSVPKGALREANNIVIRREGIAQPRPGFKVSRTAGADQSFRFAVPLSDETLAYAYDTASTPYFRLYKESDGTELSITNHTGTEDFKPPTPFRIGPRAAEARGSAYITHHGALLKWDKSGTELHGAGLAPPLVEFHANVTSGSRYAVDDGKVVAYRFCLVRKDPNDYEVRSYPTERIEVSNATGSTINVQFRAYEVTAYVDGSDIPRSSSLEAGDIIEVYRSLAVDTGSTPNDELFLARSYVVPASGTALSLAWQSATVEYHELTDETDEPDLGATLYTSPSQQGILAANQRPPVAHDLVSFRRSMFYFNLKSPQRLELAVVGGMFQGASVTASITSGTNTLTLGSGTWPASYVGLYLQDGVTTLDSSDWPNPPSIDNSLPADTYIVSVLGADATLSANALSTTASASYKLWGVVTVDGTNLYHREDAYVLSGVTTPQFFSQIFAGVGSSSEVSKSLARAINQNVRNVTAQIIDGEVIGAKSLLLEKAAEDGTTFTVSAYSTESFSPSLANPATSTSDSQPGGFAWSRTDLPEAVPLANYGFVAEQSEAIIGAKAMRESILVWTEKGVYRIHRYGEEPPRIDIVDPTLVCIAPNTIQVIDNTCYAWTNRGVVSITEGGSVEELSDPRIGEVFSSTERTLQASPTTAGSPSAAAHMAHNEYVLTLAEPGAAGTISTATYVWNIKTRTWVKWSAARIPAYGIAYDGVNQRLLMAQGDELREERAGDTYYNADDDTAVTISAASGTSATSSVSLSAGDAVEQGGQLYAVITGGTNIVLDRTGIANGAATSYKGINCRVAFTAHHSGAPDASKTWRSVQWLFRSTLNLRRIIFEYTSDGADAAWVETYALANDSAFNPRGLRHWVPREHSWSNRLYAAIEMTSAGASWMAEGIAIEGDVESTAHRRQAS